MGNRLADAVSPYVRAHAGNPVDWWPWGAEAFAEAARRQVPVLVSIGYATCHWCHVMARESFSDPALAAYLNERFVAIKVDREEHPDVDSAYLTAAGAFTPNLGWPLTVFATPEGRVFFAGTYWPPAAFRQVLGAVDEAWRQRRDEVEDSAGRLHEAIQAAQATDASPAALPTSEQLDEAAARLAALEDPLHAGFGAGAAHAPKFPAAPALGFLLSRDEGRPVARRALAAMASSGLRDAVEGGFFRYATRRDWSEPHYERMLYDNSQLLRLYADVAVGPGSLPGADEVAAGIAGFLGTVLRTRGGFASAQDSESTVAGERSEGGYYALDAAARAAEQPPALDGKVLTGLNGLAIGALAHAASRLGRPEWARLAASVADELLGAHLRETADGPRLARAGLGGRLSAAPATLEDYGLLADGLVDLALATGEARFAVVARRLVAATLTADGTFASPDGPEPVLAMQGTPTEVDAGEGAYPSGAVAAARAAWRLFLLTADAELRAAAEAAVGRTAARALQNPLAFGATLALTAALAEGPRQLVVVTPDGQALPDGFAGTLRAVPPHAVAAAVTAAQAHAFAAAGFELFDEREALDGRATLYACTDFACELPVTAPDDRSTQV
jgi:uncharacterized protein YyaL (SSP411 family)